MVQNLLLDLIDSPVDFLLVSLRNRDHDFARKRARCFIDILLIEHP